MRLFCYGTLQLPHVQLKTFGRLLNGHPASLPGYRVDRIEIFDAAVVAASGEHFHPILRRSKSLEQAVCGSVFALSEAELTAADAYEVDAYQRVEATLADGSVCWIYAAADNY